MSEVSWYDEAACDDEVFAGIVAKSGANDQVRVLLVQKRSHRHPPVTITPGRP